NRAWHHPVQPRIGRSRSDVQSRGDPAPRPRASRRAAGWRARQARHAVPRDRNATRGCRRMSALTVAYIDLKRLAVRPFAWVLAGIVLAMMAWQFLLGLSAFLHAQPTVPGPAAGPGFTDGVIGPYFLNYLQLCLVIAPLVTMQALAGERGEQRLALLGAAGATGFQIVAGKFLARLTFLWLLLVVIASMPLVLSGATHIDWGQFAAGLVATALCVVALTAIGIACSAFASGPALA